MARTRFLLIGALLVGALAIAGFTLRAARKPSDATMRAALAGSIQYFSKDDVEVVAFADTDGVVSTTDGIRFYTSEFHGAIRLVRRGVPSDQFAVRGNLHFAKVESGWRLTDSDWNLDTLPVGPPPAARARPRP